MRKIFFPLLAVASYGVFTAGSVSPASAETCTYRYNVCQADAQRCAHLLTRCLSTGCWYGLNVRHCGIVRR
jgi:hypothetical protein